MNNQKKRSYCERKSRGAVAAFATLCFRSNTEDALSLIISAIAKLLVAPGLGAFRTCKTHLLNSPWPLSKTKSSTKFPSGSRAWARTPDGPLQQTLSCNGSRESFLELVLLQYHKELLLLQYHKLVYLKHFITVLYDLPLFCPDKILI